MPPPLAADALQGWRIIKKPLTPGEIVRSLDKAGRQGADCMVCRHGCPFVEHPRGGLVGGGFNFEFLGLPRDPRFRRHAEPSFVIRLDLGGQCGEGEPDCLQNHDSQRCTRGEAEGKGFGRGRRDTTCGQPNHSGKAIGLPARWTWLSHARRCVTEGLFAGGRGAAGQTRSSRRMKRWWWWWGAVPAPADMLQGLCRRTYVGTALRKVTSEMQRRVGEADRRSSGQARR